MTCVLAGSSQLRPGERARPLPSPRPRPVLAPPCRAVSSLLVSQRDSREQDLGTAQVARGDEVDREGHQQGTSAGDRNRLLEGSWAGWGEGGEYLIWKELIFHIPTSPKVVFGGGGSAALPGLGYIPKSRHGVAGVGLCMGKTMGKGRGERGGRALREEECDMAGAGGRAKAVLCPLLAPRGCQSKNLWYLMHAQGISIQCQETSS